MSLIVLASAKGAPGVTTAVVALAHVWPATTSDPLVVELDPAGGDLPARLGLAIDPGLVTLAAHAHRSEGPVDARAHTQAARGIEIVAAPPGRAAGHAMSLLGTRLATALTRAAQGRDVLVDAGRLDGHGADGPAGTGVIAAADVVVVLSRTAPGDLAHAVSTVADLAAAGGRAGLVLVGAERDVDAARRSLAVPVIGSLPDDPRGAAALAGAATRPWLFERLPLVRAARVLATAISGTINQDPHPGPAADSASGTGMLPRALKAVAAGSVGGSR